MLSWREFTLKQQHVTEERYRFFSFGDAMQKQQRELTAGQIWKLRCLAGSGIPSGSHLLAHELKGPLENKFSRGSNTHRLLVTITLP